MNLSVSATAAGTSDLSTAASNDITGEAFLTLLAAQFKNQDPLEPMSSQDMLTQIAQLTSVSELTQLNRNFEAMATGYTVTDVAVLLGRRVEWADTETGDIKSGVVTKVQIGEGGWEVCIGDEAVSIHNIVAVE